MKEYHSNSYPRYICERDIMFSGLVEVNVD